MYRRHFIIMVGSAVVWPLGARAQEVMPVIGVMSPQSAATAARNIAAFRNGSRELGYTEGRNVRIEYRFADGVAERYPALVADLIALKPAVILIGSLGAILAGHAVTRTTPLIMIAAADNPVALGRPIVLLVREGM
jgi:putative ABC transport system substrate-binding protein